MEACLFLSELPGLTRVLELDSPYIANMSSAAVANHSDLMDHEWSTDQWLVTAGQVHTHFRQLGVCRCMRVARDNQPEQRHKKSLRVECVPCVPFGSR